MSRPRSQRAHRHHDVIEAAVAIVEERNRRALELLLQIGLAAVGDDEIGPQRNDALGVGIDQRADGRQRSHFRRLDVVGADGDDLRPGADREQDLGDVRDERNDALRRRLCVRPRRARRRNATNSPPKGGRHRDSFRS